MQFRLTSARRFWLAAALFAATLALYWPVRHHDFITLDDRGYILLNPHVRTGLTWANIAWAFTSSYGANWHPLTWVSHMVDCQMFGLNPGGHHFTSALLHALNTSLLFLFLRRVTGATWRSALVAALFGLHPLHVESVAWVAERKDVLSALFFILTLWCYAEYVQCGVRSAECGVSSSECGVRSAELGMRVGRARVFYVVSIFLFAMGLMSKPMLVTVPFVLLLLDVWPLGRLDFKDQKTKIKSALIEKLPFFALSAAACVVTFLAQRHEGAVASVGTIPLLARLENAVVSYVIYIEKLFWPTKLGVFYPYPGSWPLWQICADALLIFGLSVFCLLALAWSAGFPLWRYEQSQITNRKPQIGYVPVGWFWFIGMLVPVIGLVQVGLQARADRYTYLPSIGLFIAVTWLVAELVQQFSRGRARTPLRGEEGNDDGAPRSGRPTWGLPGTSALRAGAVLGLLEVGVLTALAVAARHQLGFWHDAETLYRHTLEVTGPNPIMHGNLGSALAAQGRLKEAEAELTTATRMKPDYAEAFSDLGFVLSLQGRSSEAIAPLEQAIAINPSISQAHYLLSGALLAEHRAGEAITELRAALELNPDWPAALNDLAWLLATHPDAHFRNGPEAVTLAEKACRLTSFQQPLFLGTLAAAYAEAGRFEEAVSTAQAAVDRAQALGQKELAVKNRRLEGIYRENRAFHGEIK